MMGRCAVRAIAAAAALAVPCLLTSSVLGQTWNGGGINDNWSTNGNWIGGVAPVNTGAASVSFGGVIRLTPNVDVPWNINALTFNNGAGTFFIGGSALTIGAGSITNNSTNDET